MNPVIGAVAFVTAAVVLVGLGARYGLRYYATLTHKQKKQFVKRNVRGAWSWLEEKGLIKEYTGFITDYHRYYPELERLEAGFEIIQKECVELLGADYDLPAMKTLAGRYTKRGIHDIDWTTFILKSEAFVEENCQRVPETTRLLKQIPALSTAFFSVLGPGQHITPHWGYYKGFLRYHLGVIVPNDNANQECWIRVSDDKDSYEARDRSVIERAEKYFWREGAGVAFDDTYLHEAKNDSDLPRVVLFLDLLKPLPWYIHYPNKLFIWLAYFDPSARAIRKRAALRN